MDPARLDEVHEFWFGKLDGPEDKAPEKSAMWFEQKDETDEAIRQRFGDWIGEAAKTDWEIASLTREQQVGLVVLLDQFPRNIYRKTGDAFAYDARAREIADALIARGIHNYYIVERLFILLPLEHSEDIAHQDRSVMLFAEQALTVPDDWKEFVRFALDMATKHRDLIRKFGRYPHRNAMIGRETTEEEAAFLAQHGRGF